MKNSIKILSILVLLGSCNSDNLKEKKEYYQNGSLKMKYFVDKNNHWQGVCKVYFESGELNQIKNYKNDSLDGIYLLYDSTKILRTKTRFKKNKEIDTSFFYRSNGTIETYSIYNKNSENIKDLFFYENGKIKQERTFFIGSGKISAFKSFSENGKLIDRYNKSKFIGLKKNGDEILLEFFGVKSQKIDSVVLNFVDNYDFNFISTFPIIKRHITYFDTQSLKFKITDSDYNGEKAYVFIEVYSFIDGYVNSQPYYLQLTKGEKLPKDNLYPILIK